MLLALVQNQCHSKIQMECAHVPKQCFSSVWQPWPFRYTSAVPQESLEGATEAGAEVGSFALSFRVVLWSTGLLEATLLAFEEKLVVGISLHILV